MVGFQVRSVVISAVIAFIASQTPAQAPQTAKPAPGMRGTVTSVSGGLIGITTAAGPIKARLGKGATLYKRIPGTLSQVTSKSFVGVTTVKQPDGTERATEIHVFPESERGAGEGSHVIGQPAAGTPQSRMTNGMVTQSRMTNGTVSQSRMTNGTVQKGSGQGTMTVDYGDGKQPVVVPPDVKVTVIVATQDKPSVGESIFFAGEKSGDGTYVIATLTLLGPANGK